LLEALVGDEHDLVTIIEGEGSSAADTRRITEWVKDQRPDVETEVHHGGQPLYPYLFSIE
jgi:dihydroxyacetone kinase-like predicted kinase